MNYKISKFYQDMPTGNFAPAKRTSNFKLMQDPAYFPFGAGNPSPDTFPVDKFREVYNEIFTTPALTKATLNYGFGAGYEPFLSNTKAWLNKLYGSMVTENDDMMATAGGAEALAFPTMVLTDPGDVAIVEDPTFSATLSMFKHNGLTCVPVPMQTDGMDIEKLEAALKANPKAKLIYVISTFQNPTGYTTSTEKRKAIYALAQKYDVIILEDNPYGELRYSGEVINPIKTLDTDGRVVYCSSYSKIMSPGIRLGYIIGNKALMPVVQTARINVHASMLAQVMVGEFMNKYDLMEHIKSCCDYYRVKRDIMYNTLKENMPDSVTVSYPEGGLFLWVDLPEGCLSGPLSEKLLENKVIVFDGAGFQVDKSVPSHGMRLNFSMPSETQIEKGCKLMAEVTKAYLAGK